MEDKSNLMDDRKIAYRNASIHAREIKERMRIRIKLHNDNNKNRTNMAIVIKNKSKKQSRAKQKKTRTKKEGRKGIKSILKRRIIEQNKSGSDLWDGVDTTKGLE